MLGNFLTDFTISCWCNLLPKNRSSSVSFQSSPLLNPIFIFIL